MATLDNTITSADLAFAQDIELIAKFTGEFSRLASILGTADVQPLAAGTALYQYKVSGTLGAGQTAEGDEVPLSKYTQTKTAVGDLQLKAYRKLTTAQAVLKHGYEAAVAKTDRKMVGDVRKGILNDFFALLAKGTGTASAKSFKAALIQANAKLNDSMDTTGDALENPVFFANYLDYADWAADAEVHNDGAGSVFGLRYITNLAGVVGTVIFSSQVPAKTIYATDSSNLHVYTMDFNELATSGLQYTTDEQGLIGASHAPAYNRVSCETNIVTGTMMIPEVTNYIVKATISAK